MRHIKNWRIVQPFFAKHWRPYLLGVVLLVVVDGLQLFIPRYIGQAVDSIIKADDRLAFCLGVLIGISLLIAMLRYYYRIFIMGVTRRLEYFLRRQIFLHALRLPLDFYDQNGPGKLMALLTNDATAVRVTFGLGAILLIDAVFMGLLSFMIMGQIVHWQLAFWSVLPLPLILMAATWMGAAVHQSFRKVQETFSVITEFTQEIFAGSRVIKGFAAETTVLKRFSDRNKENMAAGMKLAKVQAAYVPLTHSLPLLSYAISLYFGGRMVMAGSITVGDLAAFQGYLGLIIWPVMGLGFLLNTFERGTASLARIGAVLTMEPYEPYEAADGAEVKDSGITVNHLTFTYPAAAVPSLLDVNLAIEPGSFVGVVGKTGSGKSTLLRLLLRLYDPPEQTIYIGGQEIHTLDYTALRQMIGYVPQDCLLFSRTVAENIAFDREYPRERILAAARLASVHEDIDAKAEGMETVLGEKGSKLSGGQRQRVAIARALVKEPAVVLLDDVFSALDYRTQAELLAQMKQFLAGKTAVVVSQRVAAVKEADQIIVLDHGAIAETGSHAELLARRGLYFRLYEQQLLQGET